MRLCDDEPSWWERELFDNASYFVPDLQVDVRDPDDEPRLLGPDGQPAPRLIHRFGFRAADGMGVAMTATRLFDAPRRERTVWTGNILPVVAPALCPRSLCSGSLLALPTYVQPSLFFHGGYGGAERTRWQACVACGWAGVTAVETVNPRHL